MRPANIILGQTRVAVRLHYRVESRLTNDKSETHQLDLFLANDMVGYAVARIASYNDAWVKVLCDIGPHNGVPGWQITVPWADVLEEVK